LASLKSSLPAETINTLANHLDQRMSGVYGWPWVFETNTHGANDVEALIHLTQEKKARVGADLRSREINHDASVEVGPKVPFCLTPSPCI